MKIIKKIIALLFLLDAAASLESAFDTPPIGAKAVALSEGYCSVADNVTAVYYNPAGLGQLMNNQLYLSFVTLYQGLDDYIYNGSINFSFYNMNLGVFASSWYGLFTDLYQENVITLSYGNSFFRTLLKYSRSRLYAGFNVKLLQKGYKENGYTIIDPVFENGLSRLGLSFDAGVLYTFRGDFSMGLSVFNINGPDLGLGSTSRVPRILLAGMAYDFIHLIHPGNETFMRSWLNSLRMSLGVKVRENEFRISPGLEILFFQMFDVCGGVSFGERNFKKFSAGLGFIRTREYPSQMEKKVTDKTYEVFEVEKKLVFQVNYTFAYYLNTAHQFTYGNHYIELGVQF